ncbi:MAG: hypothetical protein R2793_04310 [Flavobacteriaceae bacterium]
MNNSTLKCYLLIAVLLIINSPAIAQVGINTTSPNSNAMLDVTSTNKGTLLPRVSLTSTASAAPLSAHVAGMLLYNTATVGDVTPGYYYNNGAQWVRMEYASPSDDWKTTGNAGTTPGTNFLGTTDNQALSIFTNNTERIRITSNGYFRFYTDGTAATPVFHWNGDTDTGFYRAGANELGFVTGGVERVRYPDANQIWAMNSGTGALPFYTWNNDPDTGLWRSAQDVLNVSSGGLEMVRFLENGSSSEVTFNEDSNDTNLRVETDGNANMLFIDGGSNTIGIGTNAPNGLFDMNSSTMGMVPPRVSLTSTLVESPVVNPQGGSLAAGTCVYNTNTAGAAPNNVAPGLYFWNGSRWVAFAGSPGGLDWTLTGNSGTNTTNNFLGSTDNVGVVFRSNNTERMEIENDGQVNIGFGATPNNTDFQFEVQATATNGTAIAGYGSGTGYGIRAYNSASGGALRSLTTNFTADYISQNTRVSDGTNLSVGIVSAANGESLSFYDTTGGSFNGTNFGGAGIAKSNTGTGIIGTGNARTSIVYDPDGSGVGGSGDVLGVFGYAGNGGVSSANRGNAGARFDLDADNNVTTNTGTGATRATATLAGFNNVQPFGTSGSRDSYYGGYFSGGSISGSPAYAYVGMRYNTNSTGTSGTDYKIIGTGSVSTLINDENNVPRIMFAPEAPEILFQDFGVGQLVNGQARIDLDPILKRNIYVDKDHPIKVYVTLEGDCNGIYVTNKSADGFTVKELQGGTSNAAFSWQIVANRADTKDANGNVVSKMQACAYL